ncbi:MAG TPA: hypothetical protein VLB69_10890 [Rudaea sp.]|nr:hypothetical protein [Rudaea sp.]
MPEGANCPVQGHGREDHRRGLALYGKSHGVSAPRSGFHRFMTGARCMQLRWLALLNFAASAVLSYAPAANAISLLPMEEPTTQIVSPSPSIPSMQYVQVGSTYVSEPITSTPLLCGNTSAPASPSTPVSPIYYSPTGAASLKPFVFGASAASPTVQAFAQGASMVYGSMMRLLGDPSLVCYGLDANGVHGPTPDVMRDQFEGPTYSPTLKAAFNSSVVLTVFHVPTSASDYYGYTVDVSIAAAPASAGCGTSATDCNFALLEGFDTSVFATNSSGTHPDEGWCIGSAGSTACSTSTLEGGININYSNWPNTFLPHLVAGASPQSYRFVVKRYFASGVSALPASGGPVAIAALFSPFDLDENYIGDNVAVGYGNTPPAVVQSDGAWTLFSGKLGSLAENTDSGALTFNITDADTAETSGSTLTAAVTLNLNGLQVPATPNCTLTSAAGATPVNRQCTLDINLASPTWWDASVDTPYKGLGNVFATDPGGIGASARIVVTDPLGKTSAPVSVTIHANSTANNAPAVSAGVLLSAVLDPKNNKTYPTYTCSVAAAGGAGGCGVSQRGTLPIDVSAAFSALPGPAAAFDELASQTTAVVAFTDPNDAFTNVQCVNEQQASVFITNGGPIVAPGSGTSYDMNFVLPATAPASTVSTLCTLTITDQSASFPSGQTAKTTASQFRIVVNP